jgi:hypothetical protein
VAVSSLLIIITTPTIIIIIIIIIMSTRAHLNGLSATTKMGEMNTLV